LRFFGDIYSIAKYQRNKSEQLNSSEMDDQWRNEPDINETRRRVVLYEGITFDLEQS
jgi:hypothetical protein